MNRCHWATLFKAKVAIAINTYVSIRANRTNTKTEYNTINLF